MTDWSLGSRWRVDGGAREKRCGVVWVIAKQGEERRSGVGASGAIRWKAGGEKSASAVVSDTKQPCRDTESNAPC